ncbi:uncharacterized protein LOC133202050 [Saccostrea echinata]|uniref:uncharacterized protein LOC133202050 n=1 Tax=Saccostrea echinata TaxID=191078 RepID=UPI002A7F2523|nr:uncharacterized protein LOC133202050 [Saccostrea echinata]XP_061193811.1 uncharacterized protein LOC133202050 [Saccostrea echinata]
MMRLLVSLLLVCTLRKGTADHVNKDPPPGASADPQLQIIYNDRLREVMKRFNITEADMNIMLSNFVEGGKSPTITKSVLNSNTGLQETITLDFQGFTNEWLSQGKRDGTAQVNDRQPSANKPRLDALDSVDLASLEEQRKYLIRSILTLDAESTDLQEDLEFGRITENVYRERALSNRRLYRDLMEQLLKVQNILNEYETTGESSPKAAMARRDSSRVIATDTSGPVTEVASTQQVVVESEPIKNNDASVQLKLSELEELRKQNALLNLRIREEQEMLSPSANGIIQRPQTPISFSTIIPEGRVSSARSPESVREKLLAEYRALQNRKRTIYQLLQRYRRLL